SAEDDGHHEVIAGPGMLIGELALMVPMQRPSTAVALEYSVTIRISRNLFQRVLEGHPEAARRLRDELAGRTSHAASELLLIGGKLS
ncbi:cyclic nucleotide-binding domain-containing protein, partial [Salmonella enterica]|nr:cyclic nucleotide-binding domain-containing protein [Salmonella enterica]